MLGPMENRAVLGGAEMQINDFHAEDLFGQIEGLVSQLEAERKARRAAEAANTGTLGVIDVVSKKLRPPMESVTLMADRILSGPLSLAQRRDAEALAHSMHRILGALTEVLDYRTLESGDAEFAVEAFDFHALVREAASALQTCASAKGLTSSVDMAVNCPRFIVGDAMRVRQVLMALMETSIQSTTDGSIRLYASVNDAVSPVTVRFDVTDTSPGLGTDEQAALFEPCTDTQRSDGGLGLPIARRIAEAMGGVVACDSALGQGTLYWFTFRALVADDVANGKPPVAPIDGQPINSHLVDAGAADFSEVDIYEPTLSEVSLVGIGAVNAKPQGPALPNSTAPAPDHPGALSGHVLVIEDNTVNRLLIGAYLEEFGLTYDMAETGAAALMYLDQRDYDLVLMDTVLPDYRGLQMAARIRALEAPSAQISIVALAAMTETQDEQTFVEAGVNASVDKPIQGRELYAALVPLLPAHDGAAAQAS